MSQPYAAIEVRDLEKTFRVSKQPIHTLKERALHPFRRTEYDELHVLRGISFDVAGGEFVGIIGRNGSGKSTLLKCLASIYRADRGKIRVAGRLAPFIELGVGFNPNLPAFENVVLNAVMMGLTPRQARERFDEIIAFAELGDFLDLELKNYSSGMQVRLAFSVMVQADADLLLIDEVLAVGDAAFQQKCFDVFYRLRDEGKTIVLVTHDMPIVQRFCHRAVLLEGGVIDSMGNPGDVGRRYLELNFERREEAAGARQAHVADVWLERDDGSRVDSVGTGEPLTFRAVIQVSERVDRPLVGLWLESEAGIRVFNTTSREADAGSEPLLPGERVRVRVRADNPLGAGRYFVGCALARNGNPNDLVAFQPRVSDFLVHGGDSADGLVILDHELDLERELEPERAPR